jgi:acylphosphatase
MLYHLIYRARTTVTLNGFQLTDWLRQGQSYGTRYGITGLLLCAPDGEILHVLEGPAAAVRQLYQELSTEDAYQTGHEVVSEGPWRQRSFPVWQMSFQTETDASPTCQTGYVDFQRLETRLPGLAPTRPLLVYRLLDFVAAHVRRTPARALCYA